MYSSAAPAVSLGGYGVGGVRETAFRYI